MVPSWCHHGAQRPHYNCTCLEYLPCDAVRAVNWSECLHVHQCILSGPSCFSQDGGGEVLEFNKAGLEHHGANFRAEPREDRLSTYRSSIGDICLGMIRQSRYDRMNVNLYVSVKNDGDRPTHLQVA